MAKFSLAYNIQQINIEMQWYNLKDQKHIKRIFFQ